MTAAPSRNDTLLSDQEILERLDQLSRCLAHVPLDRQEWKEFGDTWKEARLMAERLVAAEGNLAKLREEAAREADRLEQLHGRFSQDGFLNQITTNLETVSQAYDRFMTNSETALKQTRQEAETAAHNAARCQAAVERLEQFEQGQAARERQWEESSQAREQEELRRRAVFDRWFFEREGILQEQVQQTVASLESRASQLLGGLDERIRSYGDATLAPINRRAQEITQQLAPYDAILERARKFEQDQASWQQWANEFRQWAVQERERLHQACISEREQAEQQVREVLRQTDEMLGQKAEEARQAQDALARAAAAQAERLEKTNKEIAEICDGAIHKAHVAAEGEINRFTTELMNAGKQVETQRSAAQSLIRELDDAGARTQSLTAEARVAVDTLTEVQEQRHELEDLNKEAQRRGGELKKHLAQAQEVPERLRREVEALTAALQGGNRGLLIGGAIVGSILAVVFSIAAYRRAAPPTLDSSPESLVSREEVQRLIDEAVTRERGKGRRETQSFVAQEVKNLTDRELPARVKAEVDRLAPSAPPGKAPEAVEPVLRPEDALKRPNQSVVVKLAVRARNLNAVGFSLLHSQEKPDDPQNLTILIRESAWRAYEQRIGKRVDLAQVRELLVEGTVVPELERPGRFQIVVEYSQQIRSVTP